MVLAHRAMVWGKAVMNAAAAPSATTDALVVIRWDGVFDVAAAHEVAQRLAGARADASIHVDLTHVREFHDFGVAVLAQALAACPARVAVQGLRHHHRRLLRYLGITSVEPQVAPA